jgi:hypothetical protein
MTTMPEIIELSLKCLMWLLGIAVLFISNNCEIPGTF